MIKYDGRRFMNIDSFMDFYRIKRIDDFTLLLSIFNDVETDENTLNELRNKMFPSNKYEIIRF